MAQDVPAVRVLGGGPPTLEAVGDDLVGDGFSKLLVKCEIPTLEEGFGCCGLSRTVTAFTGALGGSDEVPVGGDASLEHLHIGEAFGLEDGACFGAADAPGAVHEDLLFLVAFGVFNQLSHAFLKGIHVREDGSFKMPYDAGSELALQQPIPFRCFQILLVSWSNK